MKHRYVYLIIIGAIIIFIPAFYFVLTPAVNTINTKITPTKQLSINLPPGPLDELTFEEDQALNNFAEYTSDWQTYRSDEYAFEFQYPRYLKEEESGSRNNILSLEGDNIFLNVRLRPGYSVDSITSSVQAQRVIIDNVPAYKYYYREGAGYSGVTLIQLGDDGLEITYDVIGNIVGGQKLSQETFVEDSFNKLISTFRLID